MASADTRQGDCGQIEKKYVLDYRHSTLHHVFRVNILLFLSFAVRLTGPYSSHRAFV